MFAPSHRFVRDILRKESGLSVLPPIVSQRFAFALALAVLVCSAVFTPELALAAPSDAASEKLTVEDSEAPRGRRDELDRWVPSLALFGGFQQQEAEGAISPSQLNPEAPQCVNEPTNSNCEISQQIRPPTEDDDAIRGFRAGISLELMSPRLLSGFGAPRLFIHVDPMLAEGFERRVAGSGDPGPFVEAELPPAVTRSDPNIFSGQGTRLQAEVDPFILNAGIGMAFTIDAFEKRVRVKPSFEYLREKLTVTGAVNRVVQVAQIPLKNTPSDFRFIALQDSDEQVYHAIGPGLEIEVDANRLGPFLISPFLAVRAFYFLGNLDVSLRDENEFGENATWEFERDPWQWDGRVGIRLRWAPR